MPKRARPLSAAIVFVLSVTACSATPPPQVRHADYRYVVSYPAGPLISGQPFHVVWTPELLGMHTGEPYEVRLCIGLFGPFENASVLKESGSRSSGTRPDCPPSGAVVSSRVLRTRSDAGNALVADLVLPQVAGLYDVRQIAINGVEPTYSVTSAGGAIEVRTP